MGDLGNTGQSPVLLATKALSDAQRHSCDMEVRPYVDAHQVGGWA